jgi:isoleucyl-tRNA synthetase
VALERARLVDQPQPLLGQPHPVWQSDDPTYPRVDVYGSLAEIESDFGRLPLNKDGQPDLHRPFIDELTRPNPDDPRSPEEGGSTMRRVSDVLDVWFDSGSMPYAQVHYPMENADWFASHNPGDFIVEYIGQTRGWFYTLHVLATALFDRPAFRNVISHGIVLGSDGQKMSKSLQNYPDVSEVLDRDGSDAMRWFLMSSPILRGGNLVVTEQGIRDGVRQVILPLWNVWHFFSLYTNAANGGAGYEARTVSAEAAAGLREPLDQYLLANTGNLVREVTEALDAFNISDASESLRRYLDTLTNWYVRRSRQRFFDEDTEAFDVLYTCLEAVCRVAAPLLPLVTDEIWRGLTGGRSVHLTDWPSASEVPGAPELVERMDRTRQICSAGSSLRKAANLRVRLPLSELIVVAPSAEGLQGQFQPILADELNIKSVAPDRRRRRLARGVRHHPAARVNARAAGPRLGKNVQTVIKAAKAGDWSVNDAWHRHRRAWRWSPGGHAGDRRGQRRLRRKGSRCAAQEAGFLVLSTAVTGRSSQPKHRPRRDPCHPAGAARRGPVDQRPHHGNRRNGRRQREGPRDHARLIQDEPSPTN